MFELAPLRVAISSAEARPILVVSGRLTVPVNVGEASGAFKSSAVCVAVETGLAESAVLSTEPRPTIDFVIPVTDPVNAGFASGAFALI